jgi:hypothetical protein
MVAANVSQLSGDRPVCAVLPHQSLVVTRCWIELATLLTLSF